MTEQTPEFGAADNTERAVVLLDRAIDAFLALLTLGTIVVLPWVVTAIPAWTVACLCLTLAAGTVAWLFCSRRGPLPILCVPLILGIVIGLAQLVPVPRSLLGVLSPQTETWRDGLYDAAAGVSPHSALPISLYPMRTRHTVVMLVVALSTFLLSSRCLATVSSRRALCQVLAALGLLLTLFGFIQLASWNGRIYWTIPLTQETNAFGPFVNRNHAASFLNLCLAGGLAWWSWTVLSSPRSHHGFREHTALKPNARAGWEGLLDFFADLDAPKLVGMLLLLCGVAGVVATRSRGGFVSLSVGVIAVLWVTFATGRRAITLIPLLIAAVGAFALIQWFDLSGSIAGRLDTMISGEALQDPRMRMWGEALATVSDYWRCGSGLGTFQWVFEPYINNVTEYASFTHAENQFLETIIVAGLPGLLVLGSAIIFAAIAVARLLTARTSDPTVFALGVAGLFALTTQTVQSCFDFALYMPSNMVAMATICGAVVGTGIQVDNGQELSMRSYLSAPMGTAFIPIVACGLLFALLVGSSHATRLARVDQLLYATRGSILDDTYGLAQIRKDVTELNTYLGDCPDHAEGQLHLAILTLREWRLATFARLRRMLPEAPQREVWGRASPVELHREIHRRAAAGEDLDDLWRSIQDEALLREGAALLGQAIRGCPLLVPPYVGMAELSISSKALEIEPELLARARALAEGDSTIQYHTAMLDWNAGRREAALIAWRRAWVLDPSLAPGILAEVREAISPRELVDKLVPPKPIFLVQAARAWEGAEDRAPFQEVLLGSAEELLSKTDVKRAADYYARAWIHVLKTDADQESSAEWKVAQDDFRRALRMSPSDDSWHYEFGLLLMKHFDFEAALREFRWARQLRNLPEYRDAMQAAQQGLRGER